MHVGPSYECISCKLPILHTWIYSESETSISSKSSISLQTYCCGKNIAKKAGNGRVWENALDVEWSLEPKYRLPFYWNLSLRVLVFSTNDSTEANSKSKTLEQINGFFWSLSGIKYAGHALRIRNLHCIITLSCPVPAMVLLLDTEKTSSWWEFWKHQMHPRSPTLLYYFKNQKCTSVTVTRGNDKQVMAVPWSSLLCMYLLESPQSDTKKTVQQNPNCW